MVDKKKGVSTRSNQGEDQPDSQDETQMAAQQPEGQLQAMLEQLINQMGELRAEVRELGYRNNQLTSECATLREVVNRHIDRDPAPSISGTCHSATDNDSDHETRQGSAHSTHTVVQPRQSRVNLLPRILDPEPQTTPLMVSEPRARIPVFEAKTPASNALQRNNEVDHWIRQIELQVTDNHTRIRAARIHCRGDAERVINSPLFDGISEWVLFAQRLRQKFCGTTTTSEFLRQLSSKRLRESQSPQDLLLEIESAVLSGWKDCLGMADRPEELVKRTFIEALPFWLQESIAGQEHGTVDELAGIATRIWGIRQRARTRYGSKQGTHFSRSTNPEQVMTTAVDDQQYCAFHRQQGHSTRDCQEKPKGYVCWKCGQTGHNRQHCPFRGSQARQGAQTEPDNAQTMGSSGNCTEN